MRESLRAERLHHKSCNCRVEGFYKRNLDYRDRGEYKSLINIIQPKRLRAVEVNAKNVNLIFDQNKLN